MEETPLKVKINSYVILDIIKLKLVICIIIKIITDRTKIILKYKEKSKCYL